MYGQFLIPIILKISNINVWVLFPTWGFWGSGFPYPPGGGSRGPKNSKVGKKLEYCNTLKIILYMFVIICHRNLFKIKNKLLKKNIEIQ